MNNKIIINFIAIFAVIGISGCKKFLDINNNPNNVKDANVELLLPSAQIGIATVLGNDLQVNGSFWAQYWTQSPLANQYKNYDQFQMEPSDYNNSWSYFYSYALQDLNKLTEKAMKENKSQYLAISKILTAYSFQIVTDAWGDVPFSEALQGGGTANIVSPKYDGQEKIYTGILDLLTSADTLIDENAVVVPHSDDLIYGGDMAKWRAFANTLKLKIALRLSEVNPALGASIAKSLEDNASPFIMLTADEAKINYSQTGGNQNPLYSYMVGTGTTQNIYGSSTCISNMNSLGDPRVEAFYTIANNNTFTGLQQGAYDKSDLIDQICPGGSAVGAYAQDAVSAIAPVKFISGSESLFLQAEAAARGWFTTADASSLYRSGILESMNAYGVATADAEYYADSTSGTAYPAGTTDDNIHAIINQKYYSMCGNQGFEAWTEWRRTGYPNFFVAPKFTVLGSQFPGRFLYPASELTLNVNYPGSKPITEKVWWDKN